MIYSTSRKQHLCARRFVSNPARPFIKPQHLTASYSLTAEYEYHMLLAAAAKEILGVRREILKTLPERERPTDRGTAKGGGGGRKGIGKLTGRSGAG